MIRENCDCELCENMRLFYDTKANDWHWTYCPNFERAEQFENAELKEVENMDQSGGESGDEFSFLPY